jgi:hypothetical protein
MLGRLFVAHGGCFAIIVDRDHLAVVMLRHPYQGRRWPDRQLLLYVANDEIAYFFLEHLGQACRYASNFVRRHTELSVRPAIQLSA